MVMTCNVDHDDDDDEEDDHDDDEYDDSGDDADDDDADYLNDLHLTTIISSLWWLRWWR